MTPTTPASSTLGDPKGRFAVWAQRIDGPLKIESFEDEPGKPWADDDYHVKPLRGRGDVVLDPYFDSGAMMTTLHDRDQAATAAPSA